MIETTASAPQGPFARPAVLRQQVSDDVQLLQSPYPLGPYPRCLNDMLRHWADATPHADFLAERVDEQWRRITYAQAWNASRQLAGWLIGHASPERPVAILSDNGIEHALLMLAAMHIGVPAMPLSPTYSLISKDFGKLKSLIRRSTPGVIFVDDQVRYADALRALDGLHDAALLVGDRSARPPGRAVSIAQASSTGARAEAQGSVQRAFAAVAPETIAKLLFTSGSTDEPKAVINTQRMLCSNQQAKAQLWPFLETQRPVILDWLPWNHTFGGNHNFNLVLRNGGTLYIDDGRPTPALFGKTLRNLGEVAPTLYFNVPRGYELLVPALQADASLRDRFFSELQVVFYAAASLPRHLWDGLVELSRKSTGRPVPMVTSWGATETAPMATDCHFQADRPGVIGLPVPGCTIKLVRQGSKLEARVAGPQVTPGYWRRTDLNAKHFDEDGYYLSGDAFCFADPADPVKGLVFDGRISEDFKLTTGTWVSAGSLRLRAVTALAPLAQDVVVTGHDRDEVGLLIFPNLTACVAQCPDLGAKPTPADILAHPALRREIQRRLLELRADFPGSSMHATRAILMPEPPSIDAGEITDKGYINQRRVLEVRQAYVHRLHESTDDLAVILLQD